MFRRIGREAKDDLDVWVRFLENMAPSKPFHMLTEQSAAMTIFTDASRTIGFAAICGASWVAGKWPENWKKMSIAFLELFPVYLAIAIWTSQSTDQCIAIYCDNAAVVLIINKLHSADKALRFLMKKIALWCMSKNLKITAHHIEGKKNIGPNLLSRGKTEEFLEEFPLMRGMRQNIPDSMTPEQIDIMELLKRK